MKTVAKVVKVEGETVYLLETTSKKKAVRLVNEIKTSLFGSNTII